MAAIEQIAGGRTDSGIIAMMNKYQFYPKEPKSPAVRSLKPILYYLTIGIILCVVAFLIYFYFAVYKQLPPLSQLENPPQEYATRILDADGNLIENFFIKRRMYVPYDSIPKAFFDALVATEDREFYNHWGVHSVRIGKAIVKSILSLGKRREGASTITQQLALNLYFNREMSLTRKLREAITAVQIEKTYTKNEILEMYANTVNFGRGAYGIQVASQVNFGKAPYKLTPSECAYLVALLKAPSNYDARENYAKALVRRNTVLALMNEVGVIKDDEKRKYSEEPIKLVDGGKNQQGIGIAPHFVEMIRKKLSKDERLKGYDLYRDGLTVYTTLNTQIQRYANEAVEEQLRSFQKEFDKAWSWQGKQQLLNAILEKSAKESPEYLASENEQEKAEIVKKLMRSKSFEDSVKHAVTTIQCAVAVVEPATGAILAMVGASPLSMERNASARYSLNHCTESRRQPGSAFKPFVYASAIQETGITPESMVDAGSFSYNGWSPKGAKEHGGQVTLQSALKFSINTVAARLITEYTKPAKVVALAKKMGITTQMDPYPALALGVEEVYPLDITASFGAFVNQGLSVQPVAITKIEDRFGNIIYQNKLPAGITDALDPKICKQMINMMRSVVDGGTASSVRKFYQYDAAGKTGTTNDFADAWFVGFTPQLVSGVWVGFDDHRIKFTGWYGQGGKAAAPIWGRLMGKVYRDAKLGFRQKLFPGRDSTIQAISSEEAEKEIGDDELPTETPTIEPGKEPQPESKEEKPKQHTALVPGTPSSQQKKYVFPSLK